MSYYGNIILESNNNFAESLDFYMEEVNMFSNIISLDESINIINESNISKFITEAFKRIKNAFKALIDKIKEWIGKIFKKNFKLKDKKVIQTEDSSNLHTTNRIYFVYNDKEYGPTANDLDNLLKIAENTPDLEYDKQEINLIGKCRIGVAKDNAFCFYYADNLKV